MSSICVAELAIGHDVDLPGPAELVEVVDVVRAEVDCSVLNTSLIDTPTARHLVRSMSRYSQGVLARELVNRPSRPGVALPSATISSVTFAMSPGRGCRGPRRSS